MVDCCVPLNTIMSIAAWTVFTHILLVNCSVTFWTRNLLSEQIVESQAAAVGELQTIFNTLGKDKCTVLTF
jgi:hypothetical protein